MTTRARTASARVRTPNELTDLGAWLSAAMQPFELKRGNRRPLSAGRALCLLLASHGYLPTPTSKQDEARMSEIQRLAQAKLEVIP